MHPLCLPSNRRPRAAALFLVVGAIAGFAQVSVANEGCSADPWADAVVESTWTTTSPDVVVGAPDLIATDFESENGLPGFVTVSFGPDVIMDGPGDDLVVHVFDFTVSDWVEVFELWVSPDGLDWVSLGVTHPVNPFGGEPEQLGFDLLGSGVETVTQVRVVNLTVDPLNLHQGVDLDAFEALNCAEPSDADLVQCQEDLYACSTELLTCDGELQDALDARDLCHDDLDEATAGIREIKRLLQLPPGRRQSDFRCSGETCDALMKVIQMLVTPPGQGIRPSIRKR